ncbi:hypothetical protein [Alysiella filiformis]|uniref:Uncharacterized protein n=1 Tax=Alysiella filiformis DSM 16848 TaxID=1120981 RepID=A0A286EFJ9_9NEIS|nr:hypothetical protein [Alysiella filiformis]UBQ56381.1 hypothetical protein JF568_00935 [Alysiella filiformis DSM 16848]SOD69692.1 hypothetical protein SAMN02746062_01800 [Alysiella filiformis DSM 16848]
MVDFDKKNDENLPENATQSVSGSLNAENEAQLALKAKKRRTLIIWLRVIALLFVGFFFLAQCGMSKPKAKAAIVESCIKNVPFAQKWQNDLTARGLQDPEGKLVAQYCVCMWDAPLQKLSDKQIQSFAKISTAEQLALLGGEAAFTARDKQCVADLK